MNPYIGLIIDFYPTPSERRAAIITNIYFDGDSSVRPKVDLEVFGILEPSKLGVLPVEDNQAEEIQLEGRWAFAHEFAILQQPDHNPETEEGIHSNAMVGQLQLQY